MKREKRLFVHGSRQQKERIQKGKFQMRRLTAANKHTRRPMATRKRPQWATLVTMIMDGCRWFAAMIFHCFLPTSTLRESNKNTRLLLSCGSLNTSQKIQLQAYSMMSRVLWIVVFKRYESCSNGKIINGADFRIPV